MVTVYPYSRKNKTAIVPWRRFGYYCRMNAFDINQVIRMLRDEYCHWRTPAVTIVAQCGRSPFRVLVSCLISLRTRDEVTAAASARLFTRAAGPAEMLELTQQEIAELIYPAGFYRNKAAQILAISAALVRDHGGVVPDRLDDLLQFKGVGRKTANLVLTLGFGKPGICVDTHVHRVCNRWGYLATRNPHDTEMALREILPHQYWLEINDLLVAFGQNICQPLSPRCSVCPVAGYCSRVGVAKSR